MLPNLRVMVVALLASMVGIGCGLGAIAVLRINHEPFTQLQASNPPLQLAYGSGMPAVVSDGMPSPFVVRFEVKAPPSPRDLIVVPASPAPKPAATENQETKADAEPAADVKIETNSAGAPDDVDAIVAGLISDPVAPEVAPGRTFAPVQTAEPAQTQPAQIAVPLEAKPEETAVRAETAPVQLVSPAEPTLSVKPAATERPVTTAAIAPDNADNKAPVVSTAPRSVLLPRARMPDEKPHHAARHAKRARIAATVSGDSNFAAPTSQALQGTAAETPFGTQPVQAAPRRVVVKRHHAAKKTKAEATDAVSPATVATTKR